MPTPNHVDNLIRWDRMSKTDPRYTKPFKKAGGFSGTDVNPMFRAKVMTMEYGPLGEGWMYTVDRCWSEIFTWFVGKPPNQTEKKGTFAYAQVSVSVMSEAGEWSHCGTQVGGTEISGAPDEAYKMAVTDALGKVMSTMGVNADIYLGQFDDTKYQAETRQYWQNADAKYETQKQQADPEFQAHRNDADTLISALKGCKTPEDVEDVRSGYAEMIERLRGAPKPIRQEVGAAFQAAPQHRQAAE